MSATAAAAAAEDDCGAVPEAWGAGRLLPLPLTAGVGVACGNGFFMFAIVGSSGEEIDKISVGRAILWVRELLWPEPKRLFGEFSCCAVSRWTELMNPSGVNSITSGGNTQLSKTFATVRRE